MKQKHDLVELVRKVVAMRKFRSVRMKIIDDNRFCLRGHALVSVARGGLNWLFRVATAETLV